MSKQTHCWNVEVQSQSQKIQQATKAQNY
jgi:hypothetical protein